MQRLMNATGVMQVRSDMWKFGMTTYDASGRPTQMVISRRVMMSRMQKLI